MRKLIVLVYSFIFLVIPQAFSQIIGNELIIANDSVDEYFWSVSRIDEYTFCIYNYKDITEPGGFYQSRLLRINHNGDTIWKDFIKQDSIIKFFNMTVNNTGNLVIGGNIHIVDNGQYHKKQWFCELSPDLEIIWENSICCEDESIHTIHTCLGQTYDGSYFYVGNVRDIQTNVPYMYAVNFSHQGDSISYHVFDLAVSGWITSITQNVSSTSLHIVHSDYGSPYHCKILTIDSGYNTLAFTQYPIQSYNDPYYTIKKPNGDFLSLGTYWRLGEYYLKAIVFDTINGVSLSTNLTNGEEYVYPAWTKGIDYYYDDLIFVAGMFDVQSYWPSLPNEFYIACLDKNLNIRHEEVFGGDLYYNINNIVATNNGGAVVVGSAYDPQSNSYQHEAYLLVLDSAIFAGIDSPITQNNSLSNIKVRANQEMIYVESHIEDAEFILYDLNGRIIQMSGLISGNNTIVANLSKGLYIWLVRKGSEQITGKIHIK